MSNNSVDFNAILDTPVEEIKSKPPLPVGNYHFRVKKLEHMESTKKKTPGVEFTVVPYEAMEDVDQDLLTQAGGLGEREMSHTLYITEGSAPMLKEFLAEHCAIESSGKTMRQLLAEAPNTTFAGTISHRTTEKGDRAYAEISKTYAIE